MVEDRCQGEQSVEALDHATHQGPNDPSITLKPSWFEAMPSQNHQKQYQGRIHAAISIVLNNQS
jgi:hypothetical protein